MTTIAAASKLQTQPDLSVGRILLGFVVIYVVYFGSALLLAPMEPTWAGLARTLLTLAAVVVVEMTLFRQAIGSALQRLGLARPKARWLGLAALAGAPLIAFFPTYTAMTGIGWSLPPGWWWTYLGYVTVSGLTEEVVFRAYLFGHLRAGRSFRAAATLAMLAFSAVHLLLFLRVNALVATSALLLAALGAYPLAYLFERAGTSIWPCVLLHGLAHLITVVTVIGAPADAVTAAPAFMAVAAACPWLVFLVGRRRKPARN